MMYFRGKCLRVNRLSVHTWLEQVEVTGYTAVAVAENLFTQEIGELSVAIFFQSVLIADIFQRGSSRKKDARNIYIFFFIKEF